MIWSGILLMPSGACCGKSFLVLRAFAWLPTGVDRPCSMWAMRDTELYRHVLGLTPPWTVSKVELSVEKHQVDVWAEHRANASFACPDCGTVSGLHDHAEERGWRHLDTCQFATLLHARVPRVKCPTHGVRQVVVSWAERFTLLFERFAIDVLKETDVAGGSR